MTPRKPEPYRSTPRGNILKLVAGNGKRGSIVKDKAAARANILAGKQRAAAIRSAERRKP